MESKKNKSNRFALMNKIYMMSFNSFRLKTCLLRLVQIVLFFGGTQLLAQEFNLTLKVTDLEVIEGSSVMIAVYNSEETYFDSEQMFANAAVAVDAEEVSYTFEGFPAGNYAIAIYHDEDNDGEMDRKWYGPPKEGYAFSNNFTSAMRPARYDDAVFELKGDKSITIKMNY